jgi:hypothetical protein
MVAAKAVESTAMEVVLLLITISVEMVFALHLMERVKLLVARETVQSTIVMVFQMAAL